MFGLVAYPALGIYKSIVAGHMTQTERNILTARLAHDTYFAKLVPVDEEESEQVLYAIQAR